MKQIVLTSPQTLTVREVDMPVPGVGEALVKITLVGICGSDMHLYRHCLLGHIEITEPHVLGHECVGVIEAVGHGVDPSRVGQRVAIEPAQPCGTCHWCRIGMENVCCDMPFLGLPPTHGGLQEYVVHRADCLEELPEAISDEAAVVLEPMAIAQHAIHLVHVKPGQRVAILGTGVLGTCVLALLKAAHRSLRIVCVDKIEDRLARAAAMGADATILAEGDDDKTVAQKTLDALGGQGADVVFECSGSAQTLWDTAAVAAPLGHVAVIGSSDEDRIAFASSHVRRKGLTYRFVRRSLHSLEPCVELMQKGLLDPAALATHTLPASQAGEAFDLVARYGDGVLKAIIDMQRW